MQLKDYLGIWKYERNGIVKFYSVVPDSERFQIHWGKRLDDIEISKKRVVVEAEEAFRRIRSMALGGYVQIEKWLHSIPDTALIQVEDLSKRSKKKRRSFPKKEKIGLLEWMGGKE